MKLKKIFRDKNKNKNKNKKTKNRHRSINNVIGNDKSRV
jgi:hypothetical protein